MRPAATAQPRTPPVVVEVVPVAEAPPVVEVVPVAEAPPAVAVLPAIHVGPAVEAAQMVAKAGWETKLAVPEVQKPQAWWLAQ